MRPSGHHCHLAPARRMVAGTLPSRPDTVCGLMHSYQDLCISCPMLATQKWLCISRSLKGETLDAQTVPTFICCSCKIAIVAFDWTTAISLQWSVSQQDTAGEVLNLVSLPPHNLSPSEVGGKSIKCPCLATLKILVNQGLVLPQQWLHSMGIQGDCPLSLGVPEVYYKCYLSSIVHGKPEHHFEIQNSRA